MAPLPLFQTIITRFPGKWVSARPPRAIITINLRATEREKERECNVAEEGGGLL